MKKNESPKQKIDLKKYKTQGSLGLNKMKFGLWLSTNRRRITTIIIVFLIIASASLFSYSGYHYVIYFLYGRQADKELLKSITDNLFDAQTHHETYGPSELLLGEVHSFKIAGKTDFAIKVKNSNKNYYAIFDYCIKDSQAANLACGHSFILPESEKYLVLPAQIVENSLSALNFQMVNLSWSRLNNREIPNWQEYSQSRYNFEINELLYSAPDFSALTPMHSVSFTIKNNSAYHFSTIPLNIILYNGASMIGVNTYNIYDLMSLEARNLKISWPAGTGRANKVEIVPDVNILDTNVFLPYRG